MQSKWLIAAAILAFVSGALHSQPAPGQATAPPKTTAMEAFGKGVQIYSCTATAGHYRWILRAPEATLSDAHGHMLATHFAGPSWQATDGSTVVGELLSSSPSPDPGAIAWLVLHAKSHAGSGLMANVDYVVRTRTEGGVAPATGCDASHPGAEVRVPYGAIYLFFPYAG